MEDRTISSTSPQPPHVDSAKFRQVLGHFTTGVTVITAATGDGPVGLAVGSFFSVSLDPPLIGFCPGRTSASWPRIREVGQFCVNVLAADQEDVCRRFAGKDPDKFAGIGWKPSGNGAPLLTDVLAWIDCSVESIYEAGDHDIVVGAVETMEVSRETDPLVFFRGGYANLA